MATPEAFAAECKAAALALRHLPADVRRALAHRMRDEVAEPLAADIRAAAGGPWASILRAGTKARVAADPQIVVGGSFPKVSGGAGPRAVVFGTEFGGGGRRGTVSAHTRRGHPVSVYKRDTTAQFRAHFWPFIYPTVEAKAPEVLDHVAVIILETFDEVTPNG